MAFGVLVKKDQSSLLRALKLPTPSFCLFVCWLVSFPDDVKTVAKMIVDAESDRAWRRRRLVLCMHHYTVTGKHRCMKRMVTRSGMGYKKSRGSGGAWSGGQGREGVDQWKLKRAGFKWASALQWMLVESPDDGVFRTIVSYI